MNIKIRENIDNKLNDINKRIDIMLEHNNEIPEESEVVWTFVTVNSPEGSSELFHSSNSPEGEFLNYASMVNPTMQITLPETIGNYTIKILSEILQQEEGTFTTSHLDVNGNLIETEHEGMVPTKSYVESNELTLSYQTENNAWI